MCKKLVHYHVGSIIIILSFCNAGSDAAPTHLQQTVPPGGVAVCPLGTVQYTCVADSILIWRELNSSTPIIYSAFSGGSKINDTGKAGEFMTVLTSIQRHHTLTSTATIDSVSLQEDDGRNISCTDIDGAMSWQVVQVEDIPSAPNNLAVTKLCTTGNALTVNLTWSQNDSRCVAMYHAEVTSVNSLFSVNTTSQYTAVSLQIGAEYSFRVRGADSINRLGEWSDTFTYNSSGIITPSSPVLLMSTALLTPTVTPSGHSAGGLTGGAIAGIVVGGATLTFVIVIVVAIIAVVVDRRCRRPRPRPAYEPMNDDHD